MTVLARSPRKVEHFEQPTVLPILLTPHAASREAAAAINNPDVKLSPTTDDLPWLWVGGVPRLVPGVAAAWIKCESPIQAARAAAAITRPWLMGIGALPTWGMRIDDGAFQALTGLSLIHI